MPVLSNLRKCPLAGELAKLCPGKVPTTWQEALWGLEAAEQQVVNNMVAESCFSGLPPGLFYTRQGCRSLEVPEYKLILTLEGKFEVSQKLGV